MLKRFVQGGALLLSLTVGAALTGASSLTAHFYDTQDFTGDTSYMEKFVDSTTVEEVNNQYVVTIDLKDAYADLITGFTVTGATVSNVSTATNLGVYQYTVAKTSYSQGVLSYERPPAYDPHHYEIFISYQ